MTARTHRKVPAPLPGERACLGPGGAAELAARTIAAVNGRWKLAILFRLFESPVLRFSDLQRDIPGVSHKMLTQHLRELEADGLIARTDYAEMPPRVEYRLTEHGRALRPVLAAMRAFSAEHL